MKEKLLAYLVRNPRSSFSEIEALFEREGYDYRGESAMADPDRNILLWAGWNRETIELMYELAEAGKIVFSPASWVERMCYGKGFGLPIAEGARHRYKRMHWLPVVVSVGRRGPKVCGMNL